MNRALQRWLMAGAVSLASSCGPGPVHPVPAAVRQRPHEAVLAIGSSWESRQREKGQLAIAGAAIPFARDTTSTLTLHGGGPQAVVTEQIAEVFRPPSARLVHCTAHLRYEVAVAYGHRKGEVALQVNWPPAGSVRSCRGGGLGLPDFRRPGGAARLVLRSDRLVAVEPPLEKREFLPVD